MEFQSNSCWLRTISSLTAHNPVRSLIRRADKCARSNIAGCDRRKRQHSGLNRSRRHTFLTTVGLVVGYFTHKQCECLYDSFTFLLACVFFFWSVLLHVLASLSVLFVLLKMHETSLQSLWRLHSACVTPLPSMWVMLQWCQKGGLISMKWVRTFYFAVWNNSLAWLFKYFLQHKQNTNVKLHCCDILERIILYLRSTFLDLRYNKGASLYIWNAF